MFITSIKEIHPSLTSLVLTTPDSSLYQSFEKKFEKNSNDNLVFFVDYSQNSDILIKLKTDQKISPFLTSDCILFCDVRENTIRYITHKSKPNPKYDWLDAASAFKEQYQKTTPNESNYWAWGQRVPETGEYLCLDCGYIEDLKEGEIFPVCEVCLAGDPEGPLSVRDGFWEKL